jgi:GT2 family glycosyltransferase
MTQTPLVSVHIVTYNHAACIDTCLQSVQHQTYRPLSVLVVDNASTDTTVARVQAWQIPVMVNADNRGYAAAHNQALAHTQSDYVLTLNPDAWLAPDFIAQMVAYLADHPRVGLAAGLLLRVEHLGDTPHSVDSAGLYMQRSRRQRLRLEGQPIEAVPPDIVPIWGVDGAAAFYRRAMLADIALEGEVFDEDFFMHKEDVDLCWRARAYGWSAVCIPGAVAHHVRGFRPGQRQHLAGDVRFWAVRNRYLKLIKNETWADLWRDLRLILGYELLIFGYLLLRERPSLRAYPAAWALRGRMRHKRALIRQRRTVERALR